MHHILIITLFVILQAWQSYESTVLHKTAQEIWETSLHDGRDFVRIQSISPLCQGGFISPYSKWWPCSWINFFKSFRKKVNQPHTLQHKWKKYGEQSHRRQHDHHYWNRKAYFQINQDPKVIEFLGGPLTLEQVNKKCVSHFRAKNTCQPVNRHLTQ